MNFNALIWQKKYLMWVEKWFHNLGGQLEKERSPKISHNWLTKKYDITFNINSEFGYGFNA